MLDNETIAEWIPEEFRRFDMDKNEHKRVIHIARQHRILPDGTKIDHLDEHWECDNLPYDPNTFSLRDDLLKDPKWPYGAYVEKRWGPELNEPLPGIKLDPGKCQFIKADGKQCSSYPKSGFEYCAIHLAQLSPPEKDG